MQAYPLRRMLRRAALCCELCCTPVDALEESVQVANGSPLVALTTNQVWQLCLGQAAGVGENSKAANTSRSGGE